MTFRNCTIGYPKVLKPDWKGYKVEMSGLPPFLFLSAEKYWK